ncbi:hypothetical protein SEUCBS140593_005787 [Sporothrix eucalyptigena]|uniref:Uncharacterized protein n=1 Tax=Sporothrix eucalyptigena TaxID=1812306 RepID=A0ABP0C1G9_9PEZI
MADISAEVPVPVTAEEVEFVLDVAATDVADAAAAAAEDFDFDLGEATEGTNLEQDDGNGPTSTLTNIEIGGDVDEIGYEEEEGHGIPEQEADAEAANTEENDAPAQEEAGDEIGYEETETVEVTTTTHDDSHDVPQDAGDVDSGEHEEHNENRHDIDFGFDDGDDSHAGDGEHREHEEHDQGEYDHEDGSNANDEDNEDDADIAEVKEEEDDVEEDEDEDEDEDDDDDENQRQHIEVDQDDSDGTGQDYDGDEDDDEDSPSETSLSGLRNMYPASSYDVVVTWGEQVCPLFKTPDVEDPDSFYLEDYEAMNYPLSKFLQTIRSSISSWVHGSDEIYIRVDDLGLEFGETTTEALLSQVTFHNLLALHNTLVKNDDASETKGVHITLGTRSNCLLRLKDLVSGAGVGKGLSSFQSVSSRMDESSDESPEAEGESDDSSPDVEIEDAFDEEDEDGEEDGVDIDMAGSLDDQSVASQSFAEAAAEEADGAELETPMPDEDDDADTGAVNEADYVDFTNDDEDDTANGVLLGPNGVSDLATPHADGDELEFAAAEDDLLDGLAADEKDLEQVDDLDLLEDINDAGDIVSHGQEGAAASTSNGLESAGQDNDHHGENDDDFLDLHGDIDDTAASVRTLEANTKTDDAEVSLETSATATLDHDEIDYEENQPDGIKEEASTDAAVDEIDWDDEIKNAASTSPTASGKRTREVDESGDALLDDLPGTFSFDFV